MVGYPTWRRLLVASLALAPAALWSQTAEIAATPAASPEIAGDEIGIGEDAQSRMTVPISIGGKGPYRFLVDTGAERTVISAELARQLGLERGARRRVHSMSGVGEVDTVIIPHLKVSKKTVSGIEAPAFRQANIGASGMLGIDSLQSERVLFDFQKQKMIVSPSRRAERIKDPDTIVVTARSRLGRLVLVDARMDGEKMMVVLDTGSEVTIGNEALRRKLTARNKIGPTTPIELISVTGGKISADYTRAKLIRIGGIMIADLPVAFADVHPFKQLGLHDRPALLLGMDSLRLFERVSVDFARRKVVFFSPGLRNRSGPRFSARPAVPLSTGH